MMGVFGSAEMLHFLGKYENHTAFECLSSIASLIEAKFKLFFFD